MAVQSESVTVADTATALSAAEVNPGDLSVSVLVFNSGSNPIVIGGAGVTTANGVPIAAGSSEAVNGLLGGERLFGIVEADTEEARVLRVGVG